MLRPIISDHEIQWSVTDHLKIMEHIENNDATGAKEAMRNHVLNAKEVILNIVDS